MAWSLPATALFTAVVVATVTAAANSLAIINTGPQARVASVSATITSQHQVISTCAPTMKCFRGACHTALAMYLHTWVPTEIPYAWDGNTLSITTVTNVMDKMICAEETAILTSVVTLDRKTSWRGQYWARPIIKTSYITVTRHKYAACNQIGPLTIPGYPGSGLYQECVMRPDGKRVQRLHVMECREKGPSRQCFHYQEL